MKRLFAVALAALVCLSSGAQSRGGGYYYIPIYIGPVVAVLPDPDVGSYADIHKVAILSTLGANLTLRSTVGGDQATALDIGALQIDREIHATLHKYLGARFEFVDMTFDAAAINALPVNYFREAKTTELVKALPNPGVDAYILVRPWGPSGGLELFMRGYNQVALFANYEIDVLDAHTGAYISKSVGRLADQPGEEAHFPGLPMPDNFWLSTRMAEPRKMELLHKYLTQLMKRSLVETIRSLQFAVPLPPTGDHSIAEPVMADVLSAVHSVAVVSAVGRQLQLINPGNMFADKLDVNLPITDWGLDDRIEAIMRDTLAPHYAIKPIHANREVISREVMKGGQRLGQIPGFDASTDVDAIVVVMPATDNNQPYHGLGMLHWTPLMNREADVYADYAIVLLDAHNLVPVTGYIAVRGGTPCPPAERVRLGLPECRVDEKLFPGKDNMLTGDSATEVRKALDGLLAASIPETLFHLGLDVDQPAGQ